MLDFEPHEGLTHVIDKGLGPRAWQDVLETCGEYISIVKLGWGTAAVTQNLRAKLDVLRGKPVVIGGTFFEVVYVKGKLDEYKAWLHDLGLTHVEISDGTVEIPRERKLELIADFARDFTVLSEVGSKDSSVEYTADQWVQWLQEDLEAGAWKVITEARESGTASIFDSAGGMRTDLIGEIALTVGPANVIFEAPTKAAQVWFIKQFGVSVNLGNIPPNRRPEQALGDRARSLLPHPQGGAARAGARTVRRVDHRHPPRAGPHACERAEDRMVGALRRLEGAAHRRLGRQARRGVHPRERDSVQPAARPGLPVDRLHPVHSRGRGRRRRALGSLGRLEQARVRHSHQRTPDQGEQ